MSLAIFGLGIFIYSQGGFSLDIKKASAAENVSNFTFTRQVVEDMKPVISTFQSTDANVIVPKTPDGFLSKPLVAETNVTKEVPKVSAIKNTITKTAVTAISTKIVKDGTVAHSFPYGYCTYYVSQRRFVPWSGNAISWLKGAISYGYATGTTPQAGAIIVTSEGGRTGHVGIVDSVNSDQITITEMNYKGFGVISSRTISSSYGAIMGYIY